MESINTLCRRLRKSAGVSLKEVAIDTGTSIENVCSFEHGRNRGGVYIPYYIQRFVPEAYEKIYGGISNEEV